MVGRGWLSILSQVYLNQCNIIYASLSPFYSLENTIIVCILTILKLISFWEIFLEEGIHIGSLHFLHCHPFLPLVQRKQMVQKLTLL